MILPPTSQISHHHKVTSITMSPTSLSPVLSHNYHTDKISGDARFNVNNVVKMWNARYGAEIVKRLDSFITKEGFNSVSDWLLRQFLIGFSDWLFETKKSQTIVFPRKTPRNCRKFIRVMTLSEKQPLVYFVHLVIAKLIFTESMGAN